MSKKIIDTAACEKETCLWNVYSDEYKNRLEKSEAIKRISDEFEIAGKYEKLFGILSSVFFSVFFSYNNLHAKM